MEINRYIKEKKEYNSKLSTFQISKELHKEVKNYCSKNNLSVREFLEKLISDKIHF